jgi:dipeptidyl aminopeptidase/acylaminoacyl peptidase
MPQMYKDARYSLCRIGFDPETCSFGDRVDTLYNAGTAGGSVSYPRISPDGRFLVFTLSDYGNFSIWHKEADLYCLDLQNGELASMDLANSDDVESYHSWSSNSRWLVFSSRRDDGLYTRPYICYIGKDGQARKPFLLPQKDPRDFYDSQMYSYNIPEFVMDRIDLSGREITDFAAKADAVKVRFMNE